MLKNYYRLMNEEIERVKALSEKPSLLLHCCCAPCMLSVQNCVFEAFDTDLFYFNPNIFPESEYEKRLENLLKVKRELNLKSEIFCERYLPDNFYEKIKGTESEREGGNRCKICIALRMEECAKKAKREGYGYFATTLSASPLKDCDFINETGANLSEIYKVKYLFSDFKKNNGCLNSINMCKKLNIYRQNYCGCKFSLDKKPF